MNKTLAILAPNVGALSETFIRRHMQDILPETTVVVTNTVNSHYTGHWNVNCPTLALKRTPSGFRQRAFQTIARRTGLQTLNNSRLVKQFLQMHKVQVILGEYLDFSLPWLPLAQELGIRFFAHAHGCDVSTLLQVPKWRKEYLRYNHAAGVITMSQASRARLLDLGLEPTKVHVIPYGIDIPSEPWHRSEKEIVRCLAVGRMVSKKAPILLLDAFRQAVEVCPNLRLDYVGTGELLPDVQQFLHAFNLNGKVTLHGGQSNEVVHQLMKEADIFLQHSITDPKTMDEEGLPVAILEAMAYALPVVSTYHAGIPEAVLNQKTGFLVTERDSLTMAQQMLLLVKNINLRTKMGLAGWQRAREFFTWERERHSLLQIMGFAVG